jgi:neutral ceramidase
MVKQMIRPMTISLPVFLYLLVLSTNVSTQTRAADTSVGQSQFAVGVGKSNITPTEPMWMAGYASRTSPWQEVLQDIWAKAMVVKDQQGNQLLLISLDLVGIDKELSDQICQRIQEKHSLQRSQIAIATSHTHSGPVVGMNLQAMHFYQLPEDERKKIVAYSAALVGQIQAAVDTAFASLQPVELRWGIGSATFATNRRNNPEAEVPSRRATGKLVGPVDHSVPVLVAYDSAQRPLAIVFGYACHSTVLSLNMISGDYPGYAQAVLEQKFPGAVALFWAGCGADINPLPRRTQELAEFYGHQLAAAVRSVMLTQQMTAIEGPVTHQLQQVPLEFASLPSVDQLKQQVQSTDKYEAMRARLFLDQVEAGQSLSPHYSYPIQTWQFAAGPEWVFLGGEVVVDFSLRINSERKSSTWITSYANDVMAYIPSERVLREGGYEGATSMVYYGLPSVWAPGVEQKIMDEVNRQLDK